MTPLEAHGIFASMPPEEACDLLPENVQIKAAEGFDPTPALLTAAVEISGRLGDCRDAGDLKDACEHFRSLIACGVVDLAEWEELSMEVIDQVLSWGDRQAATAAAN